MDWLRSLVIKNLKIVLKQKAPLTKDGEHSPLINQVGRAAMMLCGRLATGDPSVFSGVVRLKLAPDVLRVRVGLDHRMLFRLLPDTVEIVDLINRRDLEKRIRSL